MIAAVGHLVRAARSPPAVGPGGLPGNVQSRPPTWRGRRASSSKQPLLVPHTHCLRAVCVCVSLPLSAPATVLKQIALEGEELAVVVRMFAPAVVLALIAAVVATLAAGGRLAPPPPARVSERPPTGGQSGAVRSRPELTVSIHRLMQDTQAGMLIWGLGGRAGGGGGDRSRSHPADGESQPTAAIPVENPYCSCKLT